MDQEQSLTALADKCLARNRRTWSEEAILARVSAVVGPYQLNAFIRNYGSKDTRDAVDIEHAQHQLSVHRETLGGMCFWKMADRTRPAMLAAKEALYKYEVPLAEAAELTAKLCIAAAEVLEEHFSDQKELFAMDEEEIALRAEIGLGLARGEVPGDELDETSAERTAAHLRLWAERYLAYTKDPALVHPILSEDIRPLPFESEMERAMHSDDTSWLSDKDKQLLHKIALPLLQQADTR